MKRLARFFVIPALIAVLALPARADAQSPESPAQAVSRFFQQSLLLGAHRGGRNLWPENTLVAYTEAAKRWPGILLEGDLQLTADGQVVFMHDSVVDRTTNGAGAVKDKTLAELKTLDAGYRFTRDGGQTYPYRGINVTISTLAEVIAAVPKHLFLVELKDGPALAEATVKILRDTHATDRFLLASIDPQAMQRVRQLAPEIALCYDYAEAMKMMLALRSGDWEAYTPTATMLTLSRGLEAQFGITEQEIVKIRDKGILYQYFTVNNREEMQKLVARGIDSILTDSPDLLDEVIAQTAPQKP